MMNELLGDYSAFIRNIDQGLQSAGIKRTELASMDHLCYRVESLERYKELLEEFGKHSTLLGESEVGGRQIAVFEFEEYLREGDWTIPYLELPAPKESSPYSEGLEHVEFVVVGSLNRFLHRHPDLSFSLTSMDKLLNPEAGLKTSAMSVKFHEQQLGAVVRIEQSLGNRSEKY